jgi:hypothetical protein
MAQSTPPLFQNRNFTAGSFAETVNHFVVLGEDAAIQELRNLTLEKINDSQSSLDVHQRIGWVCRVLFEGKTKSLRPPGLGQPHLPFNTMPSHNWPLYPVALSGLTYFVLCEGYFLAGVAEDPSHYIEFCQKEGVFRNELVYLPTRSRALADAAALRRSAAWRAIKWKDSGQGWSYTHDEEHTWTFIQKQADGIAIIG